MPLRLLFIIVPCTVVAVLLVGFIVAQRLRQQVESLQQAGLYPQDGRETTGDVDRLLRREAGHRKASARTRASLRPNHSVELGLGPISQARSRESNPTGTVDEVRARLQGLEDRSLGARDRVARPTAAPPPLSLSRRPRETSAAGRDRGRPQLTGFIWAALMSSPDRPSSHRRTLDTP